MFTLTMPIARKHGRQRMRRAGWLNVGDGSPPIGCMIWDLSAGGCRLTAPHVVALPQLFTLTTNPNSGVQHHCRVVWQRGAYVGVKFIDAAEAAWLSETLPNHGTSGLYRNNDRDSFFAAKRKPEAKPHSARPKNARKRTRFNIQLY